MAYSYSISASGQTTSSIDINWSVSNPGTFGIKFTVYNNNTGNTIKAFQTVGAGGSTTGSATDSGLASGTTYRYYIDIYRFSTGAYIESKTITATTASAPPPVAPEWSTADFASGTRGQFYSSSISVSNANDAYVLSGSIPPGTSTSYSSSFLTISGTPTTQGTFDFLLYAAGNSGTAATINKSITIAQAPNPSWGTVSLTNGKVDNAYSATITASNALSVTGVGTTAPGISATASGASIILSGTPTSSGTFTVSGTANGYSGTTPASLNTSLVISPLVPPVWSDQTVSTTFVVGTAYSDSVTASASPGYSFTSGALPAGVVISPTTGVLSGTPTTKQTFSFALRAANSDGNVTSQTFAGTTSAPPVWDDQTLADIFQGRPYTDGVVATDPIPASPTQYTVSSGALPTGLTLNPTIGAITGTTFSSGAYSFSITAANADGNITKAFSGTIILAPYWTDNILSSFIKAVDYFNGVTAANSPTYSVSVGTLPAGIALNTGTGALTGIPTGNIGDAYSFTLTATNGLGSISQAFSGQIQPDLGGKFRVYSGSAWVDGDLFVYSGSAWVPGQAYVYDGTNWIKTEY